MQLTEEQIKVIKDKFAIMQSIDDLVDLQEVKNKESGKMYNKCLKIIGFLQK